MNNLKKATLALLATGIAGLGIANAPAIAQTNGYYIYETYYYSDSSKTQEVGWEFQHCDRFADSYGQRTAYKTQYRIGFCQYGGGGGEY
ncbi:DUF6289 family protein [Novosphingopyxis sp.]|uniref:DUF6289 family protein n=1 Tax=Novosphingopyxis sp. TaxID=2709690 RepID=UPI003B5BF5C5